MSKQAIEVDLADLKFDPHNPRLPERAGGEQKQIFRFLVDEINIDDLLSAMASGGFIKADPIIVKSVPDESGYFVIEGNRRLAAMKLLVGDKINDGFPEPRIPEIDSSKKQTFLRIPVEIDWSEDELDAYLGYKHVTSTKEWSPEAKARFVLQRVRGDFSDQNLRKFAAGFGVKIGQLKKWIMARLILDQAEDDNKFDRLNVYSDRYFGTFYTLLGSGEVQKFLGLDTETISETPIPSEKKTELEEMIRWSIGTKSNPPVINSRTQKKFEEVLRSPEALKFFRYDPDVDKALQYTTFNANQTANVFRNAAYSIEQSLPKLYEVRTDPDVADAFSALKIAILKARSQMEAKADAE